MRDEFRFLVQNKHRSSASLREIEIIPERQQCQESYSVSQAGEVKLYSFV
jgi:hypothetical protein